MKKITKFILSNGKHFYVDVPDSVFSQLTESGEDLKFLVAQGRRFKYVGTENNKIPVFKEIRVLEIKVASVAGRIANRNIRLAQDVLEKVKIEQNPNSINEFIKQIAISREDPKVEKILDIKKKKFIYPKDEALIKVMFFEAKRDALREKMRQQNIAAPKDPSNFLTSVLDELQSRITKYIQEYKNFPRSRNE